MRAAIMLALSLAVCAATPAPVVPEPEPVIITVEAPEGWEPPQKAPEPPQERVTTVSRVMTATHYCTCVACCGKSDGITASGRGGVPGLTCAVDPEVIPLGAELTITYANGKTERRRADDVGGAISGDRIDLLCESHEEALKKGVKEVTVEWEVSKDG